MSNSKKYENYCKNISNADLFKAVANDFKFNEFKVDDKLFDELKQIIITDCKNYFNYGDRKYEFSILHNKEINCDINIKTTYELTTDKHTIQPNYKAVDYKLAKQEMDDILKTDEVLKEFKQLVNNKESNINNNIEKLDLSIFEDSGNYTLSISEKLGIITKDTCNECKGTGKTKCGYCDGKGSKICNKCDHTGKTTYQERYTTSQGETKYRTAYQVCSKCNGEGTLICNSCNGSRAIKCNACDGLEAEFFRLIPIFHINRCVDMNNYREKILNIDNFGNFDNYWEQLEKRRVDFEELQKYIDIGREFIFNRKVTTDDDSYIKVENNISFKLQCIAIQTIVDDRFKIIQAYFIDKNNVIVKAFSCPEALQVKLLEQLNGLNNQKEYSQDDYKKINIICEYLNNVKKSDDVNNKIKAIVKNMKSKLTGNILGVSFLLAIGAILLLAYLVPSFLSSIKPKHDFVFFKANEILQYRHYLFFIVPLFVGLVGVYYRAKKVKRIFDNNLVKVTEHTSEFVGEAIGICIFVAILIYIQEAIVWFINLF